YLNSRYYDPQIRRFINADNIDVINASPTELTDKNLYAYCDNNPVMRIDDGGEFWHIVVGAAIGGLIGAASKLISNKISGKEDIWDGVAMAAVTGAASGALAATGVGLVGQVVGGATIAMAGNAIQQGIDYSQGERETFSVGEMLLDGAIGAVSGLAGGSGASQGNSKTAMTLGKQLTKRVFQKKEIGKAFAYYGKNMMNGTGRSIYKELGKAFLRSTITSFTINSGVAIYNRCSI
ncbi:MAG: RHS repeat-associated core domain-containing protein, partial [Eubacteriales bacterium]